MQWKFDSRWMSCVARFAAVFVWLFSYALFGFTLGQALTAVNPVTVSLIADIIFLFIGVYLYKRLRVTEFAGEPDYYERFSAVWRSIFLFVLWFCVYILGNVISAFIPDPAMSAYIDVQLNYAVPFAVLSIIIAPVVEELMFRGVSYLLIRRCAGIWFSAVLSSFAFGILHGTFAQFFMGTLFGIGQCFLFEYTHKLRWCIMMHVLVNIASFVIAQLSIPIDLFLSGPLVVFLGMITVVSLVTLVPENRM